MNPEYYLGQAELASEIKGFIETLRFDAQLNEGILIDVLDAFLENREKVTKELYLESIPESMRAKLLSSVI